MSVIIIGETMPPASKSELKARLRFSIRQLCRKLRYMRLGKWKDPRGKTVTTVREELRSRVADYALVR